MKSKKIVALALTAAIAVSVVSATAFAADVSVKEKAALNEQTATVTLNKDKDTGKNETDKVAELPTLPNTSLYKFVGWTKTSTLEANTIKEKYDTYFDDEAATSALPLVSTYKEIFADVTASGEDSDGDSQKEYTASDIESAGENGTVVLYPVYRRWASEEEAKKAAEDAKNAEDKAAAEKTRAEHLDAEDANHAAVGNTKDENGARKTAPAVVTPDDKGGADSEDDPYTTKEREHLLNVAKASDGNQVVYLFDVTAPTGLLEGMNARVTLPIPGGTDGYKVTVYHIVDAYKRQKVSGLDVGSNDVTFWANDFSPYVAVLTPKDAVASTGTDNPGTGDFSAVPVALLAAAALGATGFVAYKKRKAE